MADQAYKAIFEKIVWNNLVKTGINLDTIFDEIKQECPGNYKITTTFFENTQVIPDLYVDCGALGINLVFQDIYSKTEWLLKFS